MPLLPYFINLTMHFLNVMLVIGSFFLFCFAVLRYESPLSTLILPLRSMTDKQHGTPGSRSHLGASHPDASRKSELAASGSQNTFSTIAGHRGRS